MTILEQLAAHAHRRVEAATAARSLAEVKAQALSLPKGAFAFEQALRQDGLSFICEVKKASPSKGVIAEQFPYLEIAGDYEAAGADCISCLTEPKWFLGSDAYLQAICETVSIPVLRKDFTVSDYQIYEAKLLGASAVLLLCALLDTKTLAAYLEVCDRLGLSALVEAHDEAEIDSAIAAGARCIGVNNRNLHDFTVDVHNAARYRERIPAHIAFVSESGIRSHADIKLLTENKTDAVLVGETLMRAPDRVRALRELKYGKA